MKLQVYQIDAWREDYSWTYNNSIPICKIEIKGQPTTRKILKSMREKELISNNSIYLVDNYFDYQGIWTVQRKGTLEPLFDLQEIKNENDPKAN